MGQGLPDAVSMCGGYLLVYTLTHATQGFAPGVQSQKK